MNARHAMPDEIRVGRRTAARLRLHVPAELLLTDGQERCLLDDISTSGAQITLLRHLPAATWAVLRCGQMEGFGEVMWSRGGHCGLRFESPLDPAIVVAMRSIRDTLAEAEIEERRRIAREWVMGRSAKP